jgi:hypothetical protein
LACTAISPFRFSTQDIYSLAGHILQGSKLTALLGFQRMNNIAKRECRSLKYSVVSVIVWTARTGGLVTDVGDSSLDDRPTWVVANVALVLALHAAVFFKGE